MVILTDDYFGINTEDRETKFRATTFLDRGKLVRRISLYIEDLEEDYLRKIGVECGYDGQMSSARGIAVQFLCAVKRKSGSKDDQCVLKAKDTCVCIRMQDELYGESKQIFENITRYKTILLTIARFTRSSCTLSFYSTRSLNTKPIDISCYIYHIYHIYSYHERSNDKKTFVS